MAKKIIDNSNVENEKGIVVYPLEDLMGDRFGRYAKYIIQERALPDVRDGLKPVQRRILYAMNELNLTHEKPYKKSARVVGEVIGKYHPHGDSSIYEAMVRMSQNWKLGMPLIDMQGNNGSIDGDGAAAMRYTETRLAKISSILLEDLDKDTVAFAPNFDDSEKEPTVLPAYFPNILTNGSTGIAAGYATNIPPHNLNEIIDATIKIIKNENTRLDTILDIVQGPDFPTGGIVQGRDGVREAFATGKGKVIINSKWHEESGSIIIDEIPYEVVKQDLVKKIGDVADANTGLGIREVRDETDRTGMRIAIDLNDGANVDTVRKFLFKNTPLSISFNYNNVVIVDKQPKQLGIIPILKAYAAHYREVFTKKSGYEFNKASARLEIVNGLIKTMSILDAVIKVIRNSLNRSNAIENLIKEFEFSQPQATAIVDMRLYRLTSTDIVKLNEEKNNLTETISYLDKILNNKEFRDVEIISRLKEVKKNFGVPRRSEIVEWVESLEVEMKDALVERYFELWISKDGYIKAIDPAIINKNDPKNFGRKPNDAWISHQKVSNKDYLLLVSNMGTYYSIPMHKLTMSKWREMGIHVNEYATMSGEENIIASFIVNDFSQATQHILLTTRLGSMKRVPIIDLETKTFNKSFRIMKLTENDVIASASLVTSKSKTVAIITEQGYSVRYNIEDVPVQGTNSKGVKAANLKDGDVIISGKTLDREEFIFFITDKDGAKKINQILIPIMVRPKRGIRIYPERKRGKELVTFGFSSSNLDVLKLLNSEDEYSEVNVSKFRSLELDSQLSDSGVENIAFVSMEKGYIVINGDIPTGSLESEDGEVYVSKAEKQATKEIKTFKVSATVRTNKEDLKEAQEKVNSLTSSTLIDLSKITGTVSNDSSSKDEKSKKEKSIQLNLEDLF